MQDWTLIGPYQLVEGPRLPRPVDPRHRRLRRRALRLGLVALVVATLAAFHRPILVGVASLFRVDDPAPADAIVLLLGGWDHRPFHAASLYRRGLAPVILLSESSPTALGDREDRTCTRLLEGRGVPGSAIRVLPGPSTSTRDEARRVRDYLLAHPGMRRIIVVTSAFHTARSRWIFRKVLRGTGVEVRMAAAPVPGVDESNWYRTDEGLSLYFNEAVKTLYYRLAY